MFVDKAGCAETFPCPFGTSHPVEVSQLWAFYELGHFFEVPNNKARNALLDEFAHGTFWKSDDGRSAKHGLYHDQTERFVPFYREERCLGLP